MLSKNLNLPRLAIQLAARRYFQYSAVSQSGHEIEMWWGPERNNGREVVGFGHSGDEVWYINIILYVKYLIIDLRGSIGPLVSGYSFPQRR